MKIDATNVLLLGGIGILSVVIFFVLKKNSSSSSSSSSSKRSIVSLRDPSIKHPFNLVFKERVSPDTCRFRFELPSSKHRLGFQTGQYVYLSARIDGEFVKRPYTPITLDDTEGHFDLLIKIYPSGKMGQHLSSLSLGHAVDVSGPVGNFLYRGDGLFQLGAAERRISQLVLIAGGSGLTAVYQLLKKIKAKEKAEPNPRQVLLLFANRTEEDILLRDELEAWAESNPSRYRLLCTVERTSNERWPYPRGHFDETMLRDHLPPPSDQLLICLCGPAPMVDSACLPALRQLGYPPAAIHIF